MRIKSDVKSLEDVVRYNYFHTNDKDKDYYRGALDVLKWILISRNYDYETGLAPKLRCYNFENDCKEFDNNYLSPSLGEGDTAEV